MDYNSDFSFRFHILEGIKKCVDWVVDHRMNRSPA